MILLVTYDLKQSNTSYSELFDALKGEDSWSHYMSSTWMIATDKSASQFASELTSHIFSGDRLLVVKLPDERQGWLPRKAWDWIKRHSA
jgi:hypothetical protein